MRKPRKLWELLTGRINVTKIWQGLKAAQGGGLESALAKDMARALSDTRRPVTFILAERDNTAVAFEDAWNRPAFQHLRESERVRLVIIPTSSHSFARADDAERSEEHTSELQSLMRNSYAVFCLKKKNTSLYTHY